ncbi:MAG: hypothetical protein JWP00_2404 [Chloroflexi bacterium]|nr:hypothetical protein [Chloroflexota bacterium]
MNSITDQPGKVTDRSGRVVVALFENPAAANVGLSSLRASGFNPDQISYLCRSQDALAVLEQPSITNSLIRPEEHSLAESPALGAISGGIMGGSLGWLVGLALITVPGVGVMVGAGALATLIGSAVAGATLGGLGGGLLLYGMPEDEAKHYANQLQGDRVLIVLEGVSQETEGKATQLLEEAGGKEVRVIERQAAV